VVTLDEEGFIRRRPGQGALAPDQGEERGHVAAYTLPKCGVIGLKNHPAGAAYDRLFDHVEKAAHIDVSPLAGARRERPRTPDPDSLRRKKADAVDALGIQFVLIFTGYPVGDVERATNGLVGWCLVHTARRVAARVDTGDVPRGRHTDDL